MYRIFDTVTKSKFMFYKVILLLFLSAITLRAADERELASDHDGDGTKRFTYTVENSVFDHQPKWKAGTQPCPLPLEKAISIALTWLEKQPWKDSVYLRYINLAYVVNTNFEQWYYTFSFAPRVFDEGPSDKVKHPFSVIVLLDGSIVKPKKAP